MNRLYPTSVPGTAVEEEERLFVVSPDVLLAV